MKNLLDSIVKEWERTLLAGMFLISFVGLCVGTVSYFGYLAGNDQTSRPNVTVAETFHKNSLEFLNDVKPPRLGSSHAMRLQVPRDWIENMDNRAFLAQREQDLKAAEAKRLRDLALEEQRKRLLAQQKEAKEKDPNGGGEKEPPKPITYEMVFKGFLRSPSGEMLAYFGYEAVQGDKRQPIGTEFIQPGSGLSGYTVQDVNEEFVTLLDANGQKVTVIRGQRLPVDKAGDAGGAGDDDLPDPMDKPKTKPLPKSVSPQMIQEYQEFLKQKGGKVDKDSIREFMKTKGYNESDLKQLLKGDAT